MLTTSPFESFATFAAADGLPEYAMRAMGLLSKSAGSGGDDRRAIDELFDVAAISRDVGARKPDAAIYASCSTA